MTAFFLFFTTALHEAKADRVVFKNGRSMDCTIESEHTDHVILRLGSGSMNIPRKQIARLEYSDSKSGEKEQSVSSNRNILSAQHAPAAHADLAAEFRKLMNLRNQAFDANYMLNLYDREQEKNERKAEQLTKEADAINRELSELSKQIDEIKLPENAPSNSRDIRSYNKLLHQKTLLRGEWHALHAKIVPLEEQRTTALKKTSENAEKRNPAMRTIFLYHKELSAFSNRYAPRAEDLNSDDPAVEELYAKISRYLDRFKKEISTTHLKSAHRGNSTVVNVVVNQSTMGSFIFDTGATAMVLSESFAKRLGLQIQTLPKSEMVVADGSIVEVGSTTLKSVEVGTAKVLNVDAIIIADSPNNEEDGLLGMSFLRHFSINFNGSSGEIELTRFRPQD
jgi:clan AA aspartic protease (TIGR02281 family)